MSSTPQTVVITDAAGQLGGDMVAWFRQRHARLVPVDRSADRLKNLKIGGLLGALFQPICMLKSG